MRHSMKKRKLASLVTSIFPLFVVLPFLVGSLLIIETTQAQRQNEYAIYLSPGFEEGAHWGGYHVTITGFSNEHALGKSEKEEAKKAWNEANGGKEYSFANKKRGKDYWAEDIGNEFGYGIKFYSDTLDRLAKDLINRKFKDVKFKEGSKNFIWHISLYCKTKEEAIEKFEKYFKNKPWKLFEVRWPSSDCRNKGTTCNKDYWIEINS
jgi:2'-5' RNA ligase